MIEIAARRAIEDSGLPLNEIDYILVVTCTPDYPHFCYPATELHARLGMHYTCNALHFDSGCGGAMQAIGLAHALLASGEKKNVLVVASNLTSSHVNRDAYTAKEAGYAWLSPYLFGDGAGAMVISAQLNGVRQAPEILTTVYGTDGRIHLVDFKGGGGVIPGHRAMPYDFTYVVDGKSVAELFGEYMQKAIMGLNHKHPFDLRDIKRFFLHQANKRLLEGFATSLGLSMDRVGVNVDKYGNTSAAATLILFDEDKRAGLMSEGDLILFAAIGAGTHFGGLLVTM
jgi:3-oxoacyl-(acyl-carrier-protein) synthase III